MIIIFDTSLSKFAFYINLINQWFNLLPDIIHPFILWLENTKYYSMVGCFVIQKRHFWYYYLISSVAVPLINKHLYEIKRICSWKIRNLSKTTDICFILISKLLFNSILFVREVCMLPLLTKVRWGITLKGPTKRVKCEFRGSSFYLLCFLFLYLISNKSMD